MASAAMVSSSASRAAVAAAAALSAAARAAGYSPASRSGCAPEAALAAGTRPDDRYVDVLVARCAVESDFFVRDMLTWALTRHDPARTVPACSPRWGPRSPRRGARPCTPCRRSATRSPTRRSRGRCCADRHPEVARAAWRTASGLVPDDQRESLADELSTQFGGAITTRSAASAGRSPRSAGAPSPPSNARRPRRTTSSARTRGPPRSSWTTRMPTSPPPRSRRGASWPARAARGGLNSAQW